MKCFRCSVTDLLIRVISNLFKEIGIVVKSSFGYGGFILITTIYKTYKKTYFSDVLFLHRNKNELVLGHTFLGNKLPSPSNELDARLLAHETQVHFFRISEKDLEQI